MIFGGDMLITLPGGTQLERTIRIRAPTRCWAASGNDTIIAGSGNDVIFGGEGDD